MYPRHCISLFVLQLWAAFVYSADTDQCIAFTFDVEPPESGDKLNLECRLEQCLDSGYLMGQSIKISKVQDGGDILLASVEMPKNMAAATSYLGKGPKVSGNVKGRENTLLSISWNHPDTDLEMQYSCTIEVKDDYGLKRTLLAKVDVKLDQAEVHTESPDIYDATKPTKDVCFAQNEKIKDLERELADKDTHCEGSEETTGHNDKLVGLFFKDPLHYNGKKYYMSAKPFLEDEASDDLCNIVGGYLVEINDANEYKEVIKYLKSNKAPGSLISGTDDAKEGTWVYQRSKLPVEYFNWLRGQPDNRNGRENCVVIWIESGDFMNDVVCKGNPYRYPFICEVDK